MADLENGRNWRKMPRHRGRKSASISEVTPPTQRLWRRQMRKKAKKGRMRKRRTCDVEKRRREMRRNLGQMINVMS